MQKASRLPFIDAMKGIGCMAIVLHHLSVYGPMSEIVGESAPWLIEGLVLYARLAVQMFFVLAGFLVASQLAPRASHFQSPLRHLSGSVTSGLLRRLFLPSPRPR